MKKLLTILFLTYFPVLAMADGISLSPPITDSSVIYLSTLFGVVDGVLSGTGSQIMGSMFAVFNAAVLALGGIIITYTVLVGTMNTAQEGQALGEKWSSIWIPMRATGGLALLIPKASGYCLMQVFVMWVIVQGVGAADLVWNAALGYLNRGGVIIQQQQSPMEGIVGRSAEISKGAVHILTGQVCMLGIEEYLRIQRQKNLDLKSKKAGPCYLAENAKDTTSVIAEFCAKDVPDFLSSVNAVTVQNKNAGASTLSAPMPSLDEPPYNGLNGICGTIKWNKFTLTTGAQDIAGTDSSTVSLSRAIAIQQMYSDLAVTAQRMVGNSPDLGTSTSCDGFVVKGTPGSSCFSRVAKNQYGVPYMAATNSPCASPNKNCQKWGTDTNFPSTSPMFVGTEFQSAVADYNGIMLPSLNLNAQTSNANNTSKAKDARSFIAEAEAKGWLMAGTYFYNLIKLNGSATEEGGGSPNLVDKNTGLDLSVPMDTLSGCFSDGGGSICKGNTGASCVLCQLSADSVEYVGAATSPNTYSVSTSAAGYFATIIGLIDGSTVTTEVGEPTFDGVTQKVVLGIGSSTVNGFVGNSSLISVPGQPGLSSTSFGLRVNIVFAPGPFYLKAKNFGSTGCVKFVGKLGPRVCIGSIIGNVMYNDIIRHVLNFFLDTVVQAMNSAVLIFLAFPLEGMAIIFQYGMQSVQQSGSNPILALAMMGTTFINTAMEMWLYIINFSIMTALIPVLGVVIFALIALAMPLLIAWLGIMTGIGFSVAYFVPMLPYMNFLFGSIAWFMAVIEAMAAAPLIALGVTNPEGHEAFGKGESSIMILLNVFLRPALMVIGFIAAISLSYVSVWMLNEGFENAIQFMGNAASPGGKFIKTGSRYNDESYSDAGQRDGAFDDKNTQSANNYLEGQSGYVNWAGIYAFFFASLMYTTLYMTVVQNAFNLIYQLPDKVLRWIGGGDQAGQETAQWKQEAQEKVKETGGKTEGAGGAIQKQLTGHAQEGMSAAKNAASGGSKVSATPGPPPG